MQPVDSIFDDVETFTPTVVHAFKLNADKQDGLQDGQCSQTPSGAPWIHMVGHGWACAAIQRSNV